MTKNVLDYLYTSKEKFPLKTAVADNVSSMTYTELVDNATTIAVALLKYTGARRAVPIYMDKSCVTLAAFMGVVMTGNFYVLLEPAHPAERIHSILDTLQADIIVTNRKNEKKAAKLEFTGNIVYIEDLLEAQVTDEDRKKLSDIKANALDIDPLYAIFTSGSTGVPKGVVVNHRSVIDFIECFTDIFGITDKDVIGNQAPFDFDVSVKDIYSSLKCGATLQIIPKSMFSFPTRLLDYLDDNNVTTLIWAVSALCIITTLKGFDYKVPKAINKVIFSGEVMPIKHLNIWREYYKDALFANVYGPTEITCNCTYYIIDREFAIDDVLPMGKAFPNERVFLLDENDKLPRIKQALLADAIATSAGAVLGTSTTTTFVESSSGVAEGARTGLASVVTGFLFLLAIFFSPIFCAIPGFATAPALIFVGFLMVTTVISIDFTDMTEAIPAYLCMLAMPLMYSISEGIAIGVISYVVINVICGKAKKITPLMYVLAVLFVCKYIFL